jgi:hypothetical protein
VSAEGEVDTSSNPHWQHTHVSSSPSLSLTLHSSFLPSVIDLIFAYILITIVLLYRVNNCETVKLWNCGEDFLWRSWVSQFFSSTQLNSSPLRKEQCIVKTIVDKSRIIVNNSKHDALGFWFHQLKPTMQPVTKKRNITALSKPHTRAKRILNR